MKTAQTTLVNGFALVNGTKFEGSLMHQAAARYEELSGFEVTVVGGAVLDTVLGLDPNDVDLYISYSTEYGYETAEILYDKGLIHYEGAYTIPGVLGYASFDSKKVDIIISDEEANEYVQKWFDMDIKMMTYNVRDGLYIPECSRSAYKNKTIRYSRFGKPDWKESHRLFNAALRYSAFGFTLENPIVNLEHYLVHPFQSVHCRDLEYRTAAQSIQVRIDGLIGKLREFGYTSFDFKHMVLDVYGSSNTIEVLVEETSTVSCGTYKMVLNKERHIAGVYEDENITVHDIFKFLPESYKVEYPASICLTESRYSDYFYYDINAEIKGILSSYREWHDDFYCLDVMFTSKKKNHKYSSIEQVDLGTITKEKSEYISRGQSSWNIKRFKISFDSGRMPVYIEHVDGWAGADRGGSDDFQRQDYYTISRHGFKAADRFNK